jgi:hypothetical protein
MQEPIADEVFPSFGAGVRVVNVNWEGTCAPFAVPTFSLPSYGSRHNITNPLPLQLSFSNLSSFAAVRGF